MRRLFALATLLLLVATTVSCSAGSNSSSTATPTASPTKLHSPVARVAPKHPEATSLLSTTMKWHKQCPKGYGFCASFPYLGTPRSFEHQHFTGATAIGKIDSFSSMISRKGKSFCADRIQCNKIDVTRDTVFYDDTIHEIYFVEVFRSKYQDPWKAITSINGGVVNPHRTSIQGNLAATFAKGIYGYPGLVVFHRGRVYYLETTSLTFTRPLFTDKFLKEFRFTV